MDTNMKFTIRRYDSVSALVDQAEATPVPTGSCDMYASSREKGAKPWGLSFVDMPDFVGDLTLPQALNVARYGGWTPDYAYELRNAFDELVPRMRNALSFDFERRLDVAGDQVDVAAYIQGAPETMHNWFPTEQETKQGVVTLLLGVGMRGCTICSFAGCSAAPAVTAQDAFVRGQAVIGLIRTLKLLGYELEIWTEYSVRNNSNEAISYLTRVQHAGDVTDESSLEFACGHPGWARRVHFRAQENEPAEIRDRFGFSNPMDYDAYDGSKRGGKRFYGYGNVMEPQHKATVGADIVLNLGSDWFGVKSWYNDDAEITPEMVVEWTVKQLQMCGVLSDEQAENVINETV